MKYNVLEKVTCCDKNKALKMLISFTLTVIAQLYTDI